MAKSKKKRSKPAVLKFDSEKDLEKLFLEREDKLKNKKSANCDKAIPRSMTNKHGMRVLNPGPDNSNNSSQFLEKADEDFETLLETSFTENRKTSSGKAPAMPVKKRLKRYPPVEETLDLHGFTALRAQAKAKSFILTLQQQGFFTLRIIVGKGNHSQMGPVLPDVIEDLVVELKQQGVVLWFEWERKLKTRSGSLIVYLKQFE